MKGIEKITAHIEADAKAEAQEILAAADAKVREAEAAYSQKAQDEYWTRVRSGVKECEDRVQRMNRLAAMESKKSILATKQELVARAFNRAQEMIINLPTDKYTEFLARLASESATTGEEEVIFNERDKNGCGSAVIEAANRKLRGKGVKAGLRMSAETRGICGGLILHQGGIEVNCTVEILVDLCRGEMSSQLAEVMFQ
jgi:V/A-type H+/Na+-transporting ATPase subunit E